MALKIKLGIEKRALVLFSTVYFRYILQSNVFGLFLLAKFLLFLSKAFLMTDDFGHPANERLDSYINFIFTARFYFLCQTE